MGKWAYFTPISAVITLLINGFRAHLVQVLCLLVSESECKGCTLVSYKELNHVMIYSYATHICIF